MVTALLGDLCTIDSDCGVKYSRCVGGACVCKDGHAETPDRQECLGENVHWLCVTEVDVTGKHTVSCIL